MANDSRRLPCIACESGGGGGRGEAGDGRKWWKEHSNLKSTIKLCSRSSQCCMLRSLALSLAPFTLRLPVSTISRFPPIRPTHQAANSRSREEGGAILFEFSIHFWSWVKANCDRTDENPMSSTKSRYQILPRESQLPCYTLLNLNGTVHPSIQSVVHSLSIAHSMRACLQSVRNSQSAKIERREGEERVHISKLKVKANAYQSRSPHGKILAPDPDHSEGNEGLSGIFDWSNEGEGDEELKSVAAALSGNKLSNNNSGKSGQFLRCAPSPLCLAPLLRLSPPPPDIDECD